MAITPDGAKVICGNDNDIVSYDFENGEGPTMIYKNPNPQPEGLIQLAVTQDHKLYVADQTRVFMLDLKNDNMLIAEINHTEIFSNEVI